MLFIKPSLEKRACVYPRSRMWLIEHKVPARTIAASSEEMVEAHFEDFRRRRIAGNVATEFAIGLVGPDHHGERIPPHDRCDLLLDGEGTGISALFFQWNGVAISRIGLHRCANTFTAQLILKF